MFDGECSDGYEVRMPDVSGTEEERAEQCASKCASRENAHSSDSWTTGDVDIKDREIQGFLIHRDYDYCWCETSLGATCARTANNGYIRYDFTTPGVLVKMKVHPEKWHAYWEHASTQFNLDLAGTPLALRDTTNTETHMFHRTVDTTTTASTWTTALAWASEYDGRVPTVSELT